MEENRPTMKIILASGESMRFELPPDEGIDVQLGTKLERFMAAGSVALEVGPKLLIIPASNIRAIELNPAPSPLPQNVVRGLKPLRGDKQAGNPAG